MHGKRIKKLVCLLIVAALLSAILPVSASAAAGSPTRQVEAGHIFSLFVTEDGDLYGCGRNDTSPLGGKVQLSRDESGGSYVFRPQYITGDVEKVAASRFSVGSVIAHSLILKENGQLYGLGSNAQYQLGNSSKGTYSDLTYIMDDVKDIAASTQFSAAITEDGDLYFWGYNAYTEPTLMLTGVKQVELGYKHMVVLKEDGSVWTWGSAMGGALGNGATSGVYQNFYHVMDGCIDVSAGTFCTMAVKANGDLYAWGDMSCGQLGLSSYVDGVPNQYALSPTYVTSNVKDVDCGDYTCFLIKTDNSLYGMGNNYMSQMGNGSETQVTRPTWLASNVKQVSAGYQHNLILKYDGSTYGCGSNYEYELGAGFSKYKVWSWVAAGLTASPILDPNGVSFTDVNEGDYWCEPVQWAVENYITTGTTATTFSPTNTCTRSQIIMFLWRANGCKRAISICNQSDIAATAPYHDAFRWATNMGLIAPTGKAYPNNPCTRAMAVEFLWKLAGSPTPSSSTSFSDVSPSASYAKAVAWAVSEGITNGTTATTFSPNRTCTRAQIMTFLYRGMA